MQLDMLVVPSAVNQSPDAASVCHRIRAEGFRTRASKAGVGLLVRFGLGRDSRGAPAVYDGKDVDAWVLPAANALLSDALRSAGVHFRWTSLQLNLNTTSDWHQG